MRYIRDDHWDRLPTIRIHKAVLKNFKSVKYGEVVMDCSKQFVPYNTTSDVLGIYGQNGSGKTAFIEALSILKSLLSGEKVSFLYSDCIAVDADHAELEFTFDLQYPTEPLLIRKVVYSFSLAVFDAVELNDHELEMAEAFDGLFSKQVIRRRVRVFDEVIKVSGDIDGSTKKLMPIIDTSSEKTAFGPATKRKLFYPVNKENDVKLLVNKQLASERSTSFIFMDDTLELFTKQEEYSAYNEIILEMNHFGTHYLAVVDTKSMAAIRSNVILPLFTLNAWTDVMVNTVGSNVISERMLKALHAVVDPIGEVLPQFVPGMSIAIEELGPAMLDNGTEGKSVELVVHRGDKKLPVRCESDVVEQTLKDYFVTGVERKNKSIKVHGNSYRVDADTVPCLRYRDYRNDYRFDPSNYTGGIVIRADDGATIYNYPEQHIRNGRAKNAATNHMYKKMVRIMKKMRYVMEDCNISIADTVSSFALESLLWNIPDSWYLEYKDYRKVFTFGQLIGYLLAHVDEMPIYLEANGIKKLFPTARDVENMHSFLSKLNQFYQYQ